MKTASAPANRNPGPPMPPDSRRPGPASVRAPAGVQAAAVAIALAGAGTSALAQEVPLGFTFGPGEAITYDSNVLRLSGDVPDPQGRSDVSAFTSLTGKLHENYGREDLNLSATVGRVLFKRHTQLDYTQQDLRGSLHASLPLTIEATLSASHGATLAHFADLGTTARNVITRNDANADLDLPVLADWRAVAGTQGSQSRNSNAVFKSQDFNTAEAHGGIRYQPTTGNHVDLLVRSISGTYINGSPSSLVGPGYRDHAADLSADWTFSGASQLHGRAGYVKHTNDDHFFPVLDPFGFPVQPPRQVEINRNFSGPALDLTYTWKLTALTSLRLFGLRAAGAAGDNTYQSAITHTYRVAPSFQPTVKTEVDAYGEWSKRDYSIYLLPGTAQLSGVQRIDRSRSFGTTGVWNPRRWLQGSLDIHHEVRDSTASLGQFKDTVATLQFQATF